MRPQPAPPASSEPFVGDSPSLTPFNATRAVLSDNQPLHPDRPPHTAALHQSLCVQCFCVAAAHLPCCPPSVHLPTCCTCTPAHNLRSCFEADGRRHWHRNQQPSSAARPSAAGPCPKRCWNEEQSRKLRKPGRCNRRSGALWASTPHPYVGHYCSCSCSQQQTCLHLKYCQLMSVHQQPSLHVWPVAF